MKAMPSNNLRISSASQEKFHSERAVSFAARAIAPPHACIHGESKALMAILPLK